MARITVNWNQIIQDFRFAARDAVNGSLGQAYTEAQHLVPVRKVFKGSKRITGTRRARALNLGEAEAELDVRRALNAQALVSAKATGRKPKLLSENLSDVMGIQTLREPTRRARVPTNPFLRARGINVRQPEHDRTLAQIRGGGGAYSLQNDPGGETLNARGRWELRHAHKLGLKGAAYKTKGGRYQLGGRLKGEIEVRKASAREAVIQGSVVSPTYYARFVEFGTRHAAAQPYMRPALAKVRESFRQDLAHAIEKRGKMKRRHVRTR